MPNSVKTCGPICESKARFFENVQQENALFCIDEAKMYTHCDKCLEDTDCIGFNRAKDKPETSTTTARCEFVHFPKNEFESEKNYTLRMNRLKDSTPGFKVCVERKFTGVPGLWTDARCEQCCPQIGTGPKTYRESYNSRRERSCASGKRTNVFDRGRSATPDRVQHCLTGEMRMTNDIMNTINQRHHKKPLEKSRCEKSDKRGNVVNSEKIRVDLFWNCLCDCRQCNRNG